MSPAAAILPGNRLHLQHGPIDLIIGADGARTDAFEAARARFETVLGELVTELPTLRTPLLPGAAKPQGQIATRMVTACAPHSGEFVTPMAAVAGSVADEVLAAMTTAATLHRAYVNNGGDIAVYIDEKRSFTTAMRDHTARDLGHITLTSDQGIGGIATSGRHGRSHSLGIADSVTVLAASAAAADVAATLIANAVDLPNHTGVSRTPARTLDPDSDLGDMPVVTGCARLSFNDIDKALDAGARRARAFILSGRIKAAALFLASQTRVLGSGISAPHLTTERSLQ